MMCFKIKPKKNLASLNNLPGEAGFEECVGVTRLISKAIGVWPGLIERKDFISRYYFIVPTSMMFFLLLVPQSRLALMFRKDFNAVLEILTTGIVMEVISILKILGFRYNQSGLRRLIVVIAEDWKTSTKEEQRVMWKNAKLSRLIATICITLTIGNIFAQLVRVLAVYVTEKQQLPENMTIDKPYFLKSDFYFDLQKSPHYQIIFVAQIVAGFGIATSFSAFDGFFVLSILHFTGQFYNLNIQIEYLVEIQRKRRCTFREVLVPIIHRHRHLCKYTTVIEENFNKIFLAQMLATSILLCLQGYEFAMVLAKRGTEMLAQLLFIICFAASNIVSILMYCAIAEQLRGQSERLFHSFFNFKWYDLSPRDSRLLVIIMNRTKAPIEITVGKFVAFSLAYFCSVVKTSAGYLSMLLAMKERL